MQQKIKAKLTPETVRAFTELHDKLGIPYELTVTNYTCKIESDIYKIYFVKEFRNPAIFGINKVVQREVVRKPVESVNIGALQYFDTGLKGPFYADRIFNIDIKSAYPSIMINEGFISPSTAAKIKKLQKLDRLAVIGMLASHKEIFKMHKGEVVSHREETSPLSDYFFFCVKKTYEIMQEMKEALGEYYLFSWVDSVYFNFPEGVDEKKIIKDLQDYIKEYHNLETSISELNEFDCEEKKNHFKLTYTKNGKRSKMSIPKPISAARKKLIEYLKSR